MEQIKFTASLPAIQSAITFDGNGDGARIRLDLPREDVAQAAKMLLLAGKIFTVTIDYEG